MRLGLRKAIAILAFCASYLCCAPAYAQLSISGVTPTSGPVGSEVTITGVNFGTSQGTSTVSFNGTNATVVTWTDTSIGVVVPSGSTSGSFSVTVNAEVASSPTFTVTSLPSGWSDGDIGSVGLAGSASFSSGTFTAEGSGSGIGGTADSMQFVYQSLSGDGTIIARVVSNSAGQAGVMIRETLNANATDAYIYAQSSLMDFNTRASTGASVMNHGSAPASLPYWVELVRSGSTFSAYISQNGLYWTQLGTSQTITMATNVYIGLVVSSQSNSSLSTATFDNVSVSSTTNPAPVITSLSATTGSVGTQVTINGSGFGSSENGSVVTLNGAAVTVNSWSATAIIVTIPTGATSRPLLPPQQITSTMGTTKSSRSIRMEVCFRALRKPRTLTSR